MGKNTKSKMKRKSDIISKLKRVGKIKFYLPKPRSKKNGVWRRVKERMRA